MRSPPPATVAGRPLLLPVLLLAAGYFLLGRLSLLLAIPPGFASSVWPAAGLGLTALLLGGRRLWPGVLLGSFLVNFTTTSAGASELAPLGAAVVPAAIGAGAALQALAGAWAIERWLRFPNGLSEGRDIFALLALGGPVCCLLNSTVGVSTLLAAGLISPPDIAFHWWTWWVGDSIGVLFVVPLASALAGRPGGLGKGARSRVVLPLVVGAAAVVVLFVYARRLERRQLELEVGQRSLALAHAFEKHIDRTIDDIMSIEGLFAASEQVSREEFARFARRILGRSSTFQALSWNPRVVERDRPLYEAAARADGFPGYRFTETSAAGLTTAGRRSDYVVVHYIEPYVGNERALGFDISSDAARAAAVRRARDTGRPSTTLGVRLVQERSSQTGVLILMPIYAGGARPATVAERRSALRGYATGVLRVAAALRAALEGLPTEGFTVRLTDRTAPGGATLLAELAGGSARTGSDELGWEFSRDVGGRIWSLHLAPTPGLLASTRRWYAWLVLAGGLVLVSLLGVLLLVQSGRASELAALNEKLEWGLERRRRLEGRQRRLIGELELRNAELERFSYTVSHDLKSPLITIKGYLGLLEKDLDAGREDEVRAEIAQLHRTADRMRELVADLLDLSRVGHASGPIEALSLAEVVQEVVEEMRGSGRTEGVQIEVPEELPRVRATRSQLLEVFHNLLDNAFKFMGSQEAPRVEIGAVVEGDRVVCRVGDNGIGVAAAHHERIFGLFTRLDQSREGTGIGLAVVRRILEMSGGSIWVESEGHGRGSTFYFTLPRA